MGNLNIVSRLTSKYYNLWFCSQEYLKDHLYIHIMYRSQPVFTCPGMFTPWSNSQKAPIDKAFPSEKTKSYYLSLHLVFRIDKMKTQTFKCFWGLLMWEISIPFMGSLATPQIMGSCLLTPKRKCVKVYYQYSSQSLGHLTWVKILDKPLICLRYSVLCFVNFFNPPSSNENKSILNFFWWSLFT